MRSSLLFLFFLLPSAQGETTTRETITKELAPYRHCLDRLEQAERKYATLLPPLVLSVDRKLARMTEGIAFLRGNLSTMENQLLVHQMNPIDRLMIGNANLGCEAYQAAFDHSAQCFIGLMGSLVLLFLSLAWSLGFSSRNSAPPSQAEKASEFSIDKVA